MPNFSGLWSSTQQFQAVGGNIWPSLPGAPTIGTASVASGTSASVSFTAPEYTGYPAGITGYTVTSSPGGLTGTGASSPITVTGLTTGTAYTFTVKATNATGTGPSSAASNSITPPFTYVEDVFSTSLYTGAGGNAGANQVIDNDIPLVSTAAWKTRTVTDGTSSIVYKVKKDSAGNYIVLANSTVSAYYRILLIKFDSAWNITWEKRLTDGGVSQTVSAESLALDPSDNIYVAYSQDGTTTSSLAKFNSAGTMQWNRNIAVISGSSQVLSAIIYNTVDGFLYVGGRTSGSGGPGLYAKYNTSGTLQWMFSFKPPGTYYGNQQSAYIKSMAHDSAGNVYFCGSEFDAGWKGHVVKINSSGTFQWNKRVSGTTSGVDSIFIDSSNNIYIGYWDGAVFASSSYVYTDVHTTKLNSSTGAIVWDRKIRGYPEGGPSVASITGDSSGNIYTSLGKTVTKHNSSGTLQWSRRLFSGNFFGVSAIDSTVYVTGLGTSNGFITELASDGSTTSGTAYHRITGDELDSAGSQTVSNGNSEVIAHTGTEAAGSAVITTASTTVTTYTQDAVSGYGGLVWTKGRSSGYSHGLFDTTRGADNWLTTVSTAAQTSVSGVPANPWISSFNIDGFTVGTNGSTNNSGTTYASWTFREAPKFFDIQTATKSGGIVTFNHNLGVAPGMVLVKCTNTTENWLVYHRSLAVPLSRYLFLNSTDGVGTYGSLYTSSTTQFSLNSADGTDYVAYLFAHDAGGFGLTSTDSIISCGSCTIAAGFTITTVEVGFEPQWLLMKRTDSAGGWFIFDTMRGMPVAGPTKYVYAGNSDPEDVGGLNAYVTTTSTGFKAYQFVTAGNYIYMAIRKGPMKIPTDATKVFSPVVYTGTGSAQTITSGFPVDFMINKNKASAGPDFTVMDRMRGFGPTNINDSTKYLFTNTTAEEGSASNGVLTMNNNDITIGTWGQINTNTTSYINWMFRRAPSFFDEVCFTSTGSLPQVLNHNLGVIPELIIRKPRSIADEWAVGFNFQASSYQKMALNTNAAATSHASYSTGEFPGLPTTTQFTDQGNGTAERTFVAYLFATAPGVSKVGSYTGTGTTLNIDCGFTAGARFVLIKRTNSTGDWYVWDTARGIISGNDPYLLLDDDSAEVTNTDYIDPYSPGFTLSSTAPAALNASGGTYIFLAIA